MSTIVTEESILEMLRRFPMERWPVLDFIESQAPATGMTDRREGKS